jgi:hypothetical protein
VRSSFLPLALLGGLWFGVACAQPPEDDAVAAGAPDGVLVSACERALADLAPEATSGTGSAVAFPLEVLPLFRALRATGMGARVTALEAAVDRAARLALADVRPRIQEAVARFAAEKDEHDSAAFRAASETELRAALLPAAEQHLAGAGASEALEGVRNGASRLPLPREVALDLPSLVADRALARFYAALGEAERRLRGAVATSGG